MLSTPRTFDVVDRCSRCMVRAPRARAPPLKFGPCAHRLRSPAVRAVLRQAQRMALQRQPSPCTAEGRKHQEPGHRCRTWLVAAAIANRRPPRLATRGRRGSTALAESDQRASCAQHECLSHASRLSEPLNAVRGKGPHFCILAQHSHFQTPDYLANSEVVYPHDA